MASLLGNLFSSNSSGLANQLFYWSDTSNQFPFGIDPADDKHSRYKSKNLKEYSKPEFKLDDDLLPKEMVPYAVMCPKEDIKSRVAAYLKVA